jgi:formylglycine-generating enzyme required for sulfatase activity
MTEREIFLAVLDLPDAAERSRYLDKVCHDPAQRARVNALLSSHDHAGSFLGTPAVQPPEPNGATQELADAGSQPPKDQTAALNTEGGDAMPHVKKTNDDDLQFLSPSTRPDSLGRLGHYEMLQVLGRGGFGIVFRAFDDTLQRVVAIKVMAPQIATLSPARKRFLREARSSAAVRHENVVHIYEVGEQPLPYLAMEFIPGETLQQKLDRSGPLEVSEILKIGRQIAEGLAAAHACDLIHRDIKPGNILLEGGSHKAKITDFGLARAADDASISQSGVIAGTPMFMAPEQALGHHIDQRADLFSLGSVLYQMASGRPPFRAPSALAVLKRVAEETPRPIPEIIPETPDWLCGIITKLHAKNPDERFQSAREVADLLADCEAKLKAKQEVRNVLPVAAKRGGRKWLAVAAVLLVPVIVLAVTEFVGVTHLFRQQVTLVTGPVLVAKNELPPLADGWVRLFNGKDLSGWKTHDLAPGNWRVEEGAIVGRGDKSFLSFLVSESEYADFHLLVEAKINAIGDSGVIFRAPFDVRLRDGGAKILLAGGYEAQIAVRSNDRNHTGSLFCAGEPPFTRLIQQGPLMPHRPDEWFVLEVIAQGNRIQTFVNGKKTADCVDEQRRYDRGHLALQTWGGNITFVQFRRIDIKELPATSLPPTFKNGIGMEFVIVPKGKSWLGGGKDKLGDKEVVIPADFYLAKYEVTQEEWEKVMEENPSWFSRTGEHKDSVKDIPDADLKRFPVEGVSWDDCQLFVAKLNKLEKETGWVYRLPKEAEWEYACRGGPMADQADSAFDFYFAKPTNNLLPDQANFGEELKRTCKVGSYEANRLGLFDLHGNVWEWCDDRFDPNNQATGRRVRGGSLIDADPRCRAAYFSGLAQALRGANHGFRLARVPSGAPSPEAKTPPSAFAPFTDADVKRIAALPAAEQVEEVRKELMRRNPGFDGKFGHKIEGGVVTEFRLMGEANCRADTGSSPAGVQPFPQSSLLSS